MRHKRKFPFLLAFLFVACQAEHSGRGTAYPQEQQAAFRYWMRATIAHLRQEENVQVSVLDDSLAMNVSWRVDTLVSSERWPDARGIRSVLGTLEEYGEYPRTPFRVSYTYHSFYNISPAARLLWDETTELHDVQIVTEDSLVAYTIIRGRLSGKKSIRWTGRDTTVRTTEFIWEGQKLIRSER